MPETAERRGLDALTGFVLRRVRLLTILVLFGGLGLLLAHGASWPSILLTVAFLSALAFGWLAVWFWVRVARSMGRSRSGAE
jgi:protein-S-isoprenylcysteine O-methyltransferase Ste14